MASSKTPTRNQINNIIVLPHFILNIPNLVLMLLAGNRSIFIMVDNILVYGNLSIVIQILLLV